MDDHLFRQVREGEFACLADEAATMTAAQFAAKYDATVRTGPQNCVTVQGCDYYWSGKTGKFDGWGKALVLET